MAPVTTPWLRKLLSIGTGPGVVLGETALDVLLLRARPAGLDVLDTLRIEGYRERPASEWGAEYAAFLGKHSLKHKAALAVLPRNEVVVRTLQLPGVSDQDAEAAIRFQLDTLHPYGDEAVEYDWRRLGKSDHFLVSIAARTVVDKYAALMSEAGIQLSGMTYSAGALHGALRLSESTPAEGFVAFLPELNDGETEVYGESPSRPFFSAVMDGPLDRVKALSTSELRLPSELEPVELRTLLPLPRNAPEGFEPEQASVVYAAAAGAACPHLVGVPNLLPVELRTTSSRAVYIPTVVLAVVAAVAGSALLAQERYQDGVYLKRIEVELKKLEPAVRAVERADTETAAMADRIRFLDRYRRQSKLVLDTVQEVNTLLPPPAWAQQLTLTPAEVMVSGETEGASELLKKFDDSKLFADTQFITPITRGPGGELFRLKARREGGE